MNATHFTLVVALLFSGMTNTGCNSVGARTVPDPVSVDARALTPLASARIFFAHQSVGWNILSGIEQLERARSIPTLNVFDLSTGPPSRGAALMHIEIGQNGDPLSKIRAFKATLEGGLGSTVDVALLKFCFWDVRKDTDVRDVFSAYTSAIDALAVEYPSIRFVHATVPLMARDGDWRAVIREWLRLPVPTTLDNQRRHELSELIRSRYPAESIFDIESLESDAPPGDRTPHLSTAMTTDGGHLNAEGQRRAAQVFMKVLSDAVSRGGNAASATSR